MVLAVAGTVLAVPACAGGGDGTGPGPAPGDPAPPVSASAPTATTAATAVPPTVSPRPLTGQTIAIDPGHNGRNAAHRDEINRPVDIGTGTKACNTTGTATADGYAEATFNWEVAVRVRAALEQLGATVVLTRTDNDGWGPCIDERARTANRAQADAAVSIHADGGPAEGRGFHVIHPTPIPGLTDDIAAPSRELAVALRAALRRTEMPVADYIARDGLAERGDLGGLNLSDVPAVLLEAGNLRNATDAALLRGAAFQALLADAVAEALVEFLT